MRRKGKNVKMVRRNNNKNVLVTIIVIVSIVALIFLAANGFNFKSLSISGTNTISLSQASLQSSNPFFSGKVWLLTFSSGGLGQRYTGTFSPNQIQSATPDSSTTTKDFTIDVQYSDQTCNYAIQQTSQNLPIYDLQIETFSAVTHPLCTLNNAYENTGLTNIFSYGKRSFSTQCYAIGYNTQSPVGNLQNPNLESQFTINLNAGGSVASKTINTLSGTTQGAIGDFAYASWSGNLVSGQSCPSQSPYKAVYVNGIWRTTSSSDYNSYISLFNQIYSIGDSASEQENWYVGMSNAISKAKLSKTFGSINSATSLNNAQVKITLQNQIQFPVTSLYIKADTLGIYTPTPEIKLVNADSSCFQTGEQGGISVILRNDGGETGTWNIYAVCESPFTSTSNLQVSLQPGESITRVIPLSASASSEQRAKCTIFAESPAGTKQLTADVCVKPQITCSPNTKFCATSGDYKFVRQCSSDGATSSILKVCGLNEYCEDAQCKSFNSGGNQGTSFLDKIKNFFNSIGDFFTILKIVFVFIVFLFVMLFSKDIISNFINQEWLDWVLGFIIGGLAGILAYKIFWIGIIALIVFVILKLTPLGKSYNRWRR